MITLLGNPRRCCDGITRRELLTAGALAVLGPEFTLSNVLRADERGSHGRRGGQAKSVILLYLHGGAATQDMWDLKPDAPREMRGEFHPIATSAAGVQICEHMPRLARWMHKAAVVRSVNHRAGCHNPLPCYSGYAQPPRGGGPNGAAQAEDPPSMGSVCEYLRQHAGTAARRDDDVLPDYLHLPCWLGRFRGPPMRWSGPYAGFLGARYDPLFADCAPHSAGGARAPDYWHPVTVHGQPSLPNSSLVADMTAERLNGRRTLLQAIDQQLQQVERQPLDGHDRMQQRAFDVLTSTRSRQAFDLAQEDARLLDRYGRTLFGNSALIARRLVQAGVRFVTVCWDQYETMTPVAWDTHQRNFPMLREHHLPELDRTCSALLEDLDARGLLDETLVAIMSEMGRTPLINKDGGRDHWTSCYSIVLAGAGIQGGVVYGSSDRQAAYVKDRPVSPADICATIYRCLGIDPEMTVPDRTARPMAIAHGGRAIGEILG